MNPDIRLRPLTWRNMRFFMALLKEPTVVAEQPFDQPLSYFALLQLYLRSVLGFKGMLMSRVIYFKDIPIGLILLDEFMPIHQRAAISYDVLPAYRGRGFASQSIDQFCAYVFKHQPMLNRIDAFVRVGHTQSTYALNQAHFSFEGRLKQYKYFKGQLIDIDIFRRCRYDG